MVWFVPDRVGGLARRPYKSEEEIDDECEGFLRTYFGLAPGQSLPLPLSTDLLTTMIEAYAERLDLYADVEAGVEGLTKISANDRPFVRISRALSAAPHLTNRLRSTLAHEFYHLYFHTPLYQEKLKQMELFGSPMERIACRRETILEGKKVDWREWQAAYGAGALLIPVSALWQVIREHGDAFGSPPYVAAGPGAWSVVSLVAASFEVSREAAVVRLWQKRFLQSVADSQQLSLLAGEEGRDR